MEAKKKKIQIKMVIIKMNIHKISNKNNIRILIKIIQANKINLINHLLINKFHLIIINFKAAMIK